MKTLERLTTEEIIEGRVYELIQKFPDLKFQKAKQLLLNVLADNAIGAAIANRAQQYIETPSRWEVQVVEPTADAEKVLVTLECPECGSEYWFKVRRHCPDDLYKRAHAACLSCGQELKAPKMIAL